MREVMRMTHTMSPVMIWNSSYGDLQAQVAAAIGMQQVTYLMPARGMRILVPQPRVLSY